MDPTASTRSAGGSGASTPGADVSPVVDLTDLPGIGPAYKERLQGAGVADVAALAKTSDLDELAETSGIPRARLDEFQEAAKAALPAAPEAMPRVVDVTTTQEEPEPQAARAEAPSPSVREAAHNIADAVRQAAEDMRVVLIDTAATARVKVGSIWHDSVPIITARYHENEERIARAMKENGVVLKEQAATAIVRINDEVYSGLPIFKERVREGADQVREEIRVRVKEIRDRTQKQPLWRRLFGG